MSRGRHAERELTALDSLPHLTRAVVHGDLGAENVLWEWSHGLPHLSGVLDWDDVTLTDSLPASPRSAAHSPCSKPSTQSATATKKNSRTVWPATAEAHRHIRIIERSTATATR